MHLGVPALLEFFRQHQDEESLVLVTIIGTEGSTYRKPGAMMLIGQDNQFEGMISGGCLEGDLLHHAAEVFESGEAKFVTYDMHANDDLVWNLGLGCDGIIHLMLQRLDRDNGFGFLDKLNSSFTNRNSVLLALSLDPKSDRPAGESALLDNSGLESGAPDLVGMLRPLQADGWPEWRYRRLGASRSDGQGEIIVINIPPQVSVLVCGAGPDAVPVARTLSGLDWKVTVVDHRPAFAREDRFPASCTVICTRPARLHENLNLDTLDAAVIMSHHLENDGQYLSQLSEKGLKYVGCLGPASRAKKLMEMTEWSGQKVYGPVGLDIGAELPEAIALSLASEMHAILNNRTGFPLTEKP